jgi:fatty acid amide hydrolase
MTDTRSTVGLTMRAEKIIKEDGPLVRCLKNSGMIPFMKTNIPQLGFTYETNNMLWGRCLNPWKKSKTTGGSSGGEAASIAAKISVIGVGNDYGGSVRIPAQFCGICALLPSTNRIMINEAITKYSLAFNGKDFIKNMNGPLARSIDSLALWVYVTTTESFYEGFHDPYIKLMPFNFKLYKEIDNIRRPLRIGYI